MGLCLPPGKSWVWVTSTEKLGNQLTYRDPEIYSKDLSILFFYKCHFYCIKVIIALTFMYILSIFLLLKTSLQINSSTGNFWHMSI